MAMKSRQKLDSKLVVFAGPGVSKRQETGKTPSELLIYIFSSPLSQRNVKENSKIRGLEEPKEGIISPYNKVNGY